MNRNKQAYKQKVEAEMREWEAKTELLKAKGNNLMADAKLEFEKQLQKLQDNKSEFTVYYDKLKDKADDTWDDVKEEAEEKWTKFTGKLSDFVNKYT